jgi:parallel beta-helix repeat protein
MIPVIAQPSGGPYGPLQITYDIPETKGKIYYVSPGGRNEETGESVNNPTSIEAAFERVVTGDVIIMRGGTYRTGNLLLNQGITIQPYKDEKPVLKGTYVAKEWKKEETGLWVTTWNRLFPSGPQNWWRRYREGAKTPMHRFNNDMVFVDGRFLQSAGWEGEVDERSYFINYDSSKVYIGIDPTDKLVEITAFDAAINRITGECYGKISDFKGPVIKGITLSQYAYCVIDIEGTEPEGISSESEHGKLVVGTTLEHCDISYGSRVAAWLRGDSLTVRHCKISNTSTEGIYIIASSDVLLEKNIFTSNNIERLTGYYPAAVKIFNQSHRVTCRDNLVIDLPYSHGIWYDVGTVDGVFINNWIQNVGNLDREFKKNKPYPCKNGLFFEISRSLICARNVFVNCDQGMYVLNSSDAHIYQNTFVNSIACIGRNERSAAGDHFAWHPSTGPDIDERYGHIFVNNIMAGDKDFHRPLLFVWQPSDTLCQELDKPQLKQLDNNIYIRDRDENSYPLILWSPSENVDCQLPFESPAELNKIYSGFSVHGKYYTNDIRPVFKSSNLNNYKLIREFPGYKAGQLPEEVIQILGYPKKGINFAGAYSP